MEKKNSSNSSAFLWLIVGAYLIYLVYRMLRSGELDFHSPIKIIITVLFFISGILFIFFGLKRYAKTAQQSAEQNNKSADKSTVLSEHQHKEGGEDH